MTKSLFTDSQIVDALKAWEMVWLCLTYAESLTISITPFYNWWH